MGPFTRMMRLNPRYLQRISPVRLYTAKNDSFFALFPKSFPEGGPPKDSFQVNLRQLRREYRVLQSQNHPDVMIGSSSLSDRPVDNVDSEGDRASSAINEAYTTLRNPYTRAAYVIQQAHPDKIDITKDDTSKEFIAQIQSSSKEQSLNYKELLMTVLEAHESLEFAGSEADLAALEEENSERIAKSEESLNKILGASPIQWDDFIIETIKLKYWVNIANGIKEWEQGKPVLLTH